MPSTYTANDGIEQPATGEQSGTWGQTVDNGLGFIDSSLHGIQFIALGATTYALTTTNGASSLGRTRAVVFTGTPGGTATVTVAPSTAQKCYFILNQTNQSLIIQQGGGSGTKVTIAASQAEPVYCDGTGANANVAKLHALVADQVAEGATNKYYLDSRVRAALSVSTSASDAIVAYNSGTGVTTSQFWAEAWQLLTLQNGWTAGNQAPRYRLSNNHRVYLDGIAVSASAGQVSIICTLPAGRRPPVAAKRFSLGSDATAGSVNVVVNPDGTIVPVTNATGSGARIGVDGISFTID